MPENADVDAVDPLVTKLGTVHFNALRNALYHTGRRRFFLRWNRVFTFLIILLGTAAFSDTFGSLRPLGDQFPTIAQIAAFLTATIGALQLVIDFGGNARDHHQLHRRYNDISAAIKETVTPDWAQVGKWEAELDRITSDEPPVMMAADAVAYNQAANSLGVSKRDLLVIPWHHLPFRNFLSYASHRYLWEWEKDAADGRPTRTNGR